MNRMMRGVPYSNDSYMMAQRGQRSGCNRQSPQRCAPSHNDEELLRRLSEIDFAIYDTVLYLDAYPDCAEALAHYHMLCDARRPLVVEYEKAVGPITAFSNANRTAWEWTATPWPWQK